MTFQCADGGPTNFHRRAVVRPFVWTANPDRIIVAVKRGRSYPRHICPVLVLNAGDGMFFVLFVTSNRMTHSSTRGNLLPAPIIFKTIVPI